MAKMKMRRPKLVCKKPSKTVISSAYEADINNMISGKVPMTQSKSSFYIDERLYPDNYEAALQLVIEANNTFMMLPPEIRERFGNDPAKLAAAFDDPKQHDELVKLGIVQDPSAQGDDVVVKPVMRPSDSPGTVPLAKPQGPLSGPAVATDGATHE